MDRIKRQFETNVIGLLAATKAVLPHMRANGAGTSIKVKIVEPGMIATDFGGRSFDFVNDEAMTEYQPVVQALFSTWGSEEMTSRASPPQVVADVIWQAVTDGTDTLRYRAGADAVELLDNRKALDDATFIGGLKAQLGLS